MILSAKSFAKVINHTPLVSIDLIVVNKSKEILLGKRINAPAKGFWFVPGGRVFKNESLDAPADSFGHPAVFYSDTLPVVNL